MGTNSNLSYFSPLTVNVLCLLNKMGMFSKAFNSFKSANCFDFDQPL